MTLLSLPLTRCQTFRAKLVIVCGHGAKDVDARFGIIADRVQRGTVVNHEDASLPIYNELLTFGNLGSGTACLGAGDAISGIRIDSAESRVIRLGYDLFDEIQFLISAGQPAEYAHIPTLDIHIGMLREWILAAGLPLLEIPPSPANYSFIACLTHDIDFIGIRQHFLDHSMWGFAYRATLGAIRNFAREGSP